MYDDDEKAEVGVCPDDGCPCPCCPWFDFCYEEDE